MRSNYLVNKAMDGEYRSGTHPWAPPANRHVGILVAGKGLRSALNSQTVALNDLVAVVANDGKTHLYKVTTAGTLASAQGVLYPGTPNEAISDGTATLTEQDAALRANTAGVVVEPSGGSYARVAVSSTPGASAGFSAAGNGAAGSATGASAAALTGSAPVGVVANNAAITFPAPTGDWAKSPAVWWASASWDSAIGGTNNLLEICPIPGASMPKNVANNDQAPNIPAGGMTLGEN